MRTLTWLEATAGVAELDPLWRFLAEQVAGLADGRVHTRVQHVAVAAGGIRTPANRLLSDAAILASALQAEAESDVLVIGCWGAPTAPVRAAVGIPVSSLPDASVRLVGSLARRAAVVTVAPALVPIFSDDLVGLGATGFLPGAPVRSYQPESTHVEVLDAITDPSSCSSRTPASSRPRSATCAPPGRRRPPCVRRPAGSPHDSSPDASASLRPEPSKGTTHPCPATA